MSGTKSKMMEMSAAAAVSNHKPADMSATHGHSEVGGVSKGTATLIELRAVNSVTPDPTNMANPQHNASQTYNNASKLLNAANEDISDYGGGATHAANRKVV